MRVPWLDAFIALYCCLAMSHPRAARPSAQDRHFFDAAEADPAAAARLLGVRFGLSLEGGPVPWCGPTLIALWRVLSGLPPSAVADNPALRRLVRADGVDGLGVYHDHRTRSPFGPHSAEVSVRSL